MKIPVLLIIPALGLLTGCGHNVVEYGDGIGFSVGVNPETYTLSIGLRYGKLLSAAVRDNVKISMTGAVKSGSVQAGVASSDDLVIDIGRQINGAASDLVKAGASGDAVAKTLK